MVMDEYDSGHSTGYNDAHTIDIYKNSDIKNIADNYLKINALNRESARRIIKSKKNRLVCKDVDTCTYTDYEKNGQRLKVEKIILWFEDFLQKGKNMLDLLKPDNIAYVCFRFCDFIGAQDQYNDQFDWYLARIWNCNEHSNRIDDRCTINVPGYCDYDCDEDKNISHDLKDKEIIEAFLIDFKSQHSNATDIECQQIAKSIRDNIDIGRKIIEIAQTRIFACIAFKIVYSPLRGDAKEYILKVWCSRSC
jgi:hypothetical protein